MGRKRKDSQSTRRCLHVSMLAWVCGLCDVMLATPECIYYVSVITSKEKRSLYEIAIQLDRAVDSARRRAKMAEIDFWKLLCSEYKQHDMSRKSFSRQIPRSGNVHSCGPSYCLDSLNLINTLPWPKKKKKKTGTAENHEVNRTLFNHVMPCSITNDQRSTHSH